MIELLGTDKATLARFAIFLRTLADVELRRIANTDPRLEFTIVKHRHRLTAYRDAFKLVSSEIEELDE